MLPFNSVDYHLPATIMGFILLVDAEGDPNCIVWFVIHMPHMNTPCS